jgi:hypothetical protein
MICFGSFLQIGCCSSQILRTSRPFRTAGNGMSRLG